MAQRQDGKPAAGAAGKSLCGGFGTCLGVLCEVDKCGKFSASGGKPDDDKSTA
ncbi:MAG: hypothetical protein ACI4AB_08180 [Acetatifactor sp.]